MEIPIIRGQLAETVLPHSLAWPAIEAPRTATGSSGSEQVMAYAIYGKTSVTGFLTAFSNIIKAFSQDGSQKEENGM